MKMGRKKIKKKKQEGINRRRFGYNLAAWSIGAILAMGSFSIIQQGYTSWRKDQEYDSKRQDQLKSIEKARSLLINDVYNNQKHFLDLDQEEKKDILEDISNFYTKLVRHYNLRFGKGSPVSKTLADNSTIDAIANNDFSEENIDRTSSLDNLNKESISRYLSQLMPLKSSGKELFKVTKDHYSAHSLEKIAEINKVDYQEVSQMYLFFYKEFQRHFTSEEHLRNVSVNLVAAAVLNKGNYESIKEISMELMKANIISALELGIIPYAVISGISICQDTKEGRLYRLTEKELLLLNPKRFISRKARTIEDPNTRIKEPFLEAYLIYGSKFHEKVKQTLYATIPKKPIIN